MSIITLTTDFGTKDYLVAAVKGEILKELSDAVIVDITHEINPFDIAEAAYIVKNAYKYFPKGSIHIIGVDAISLSGQNPICALVDDHYFICGNNGILSLIFSEISPTEIVEINVFVDNKKSLFPTKETFVPVACHLSRGGTLSLIGNRITEVKDLQFVQPFVRDDRFIQGTVVFIDNFGNVVTNISHKLFNQIGKKRNFTVRVRNHEFREILENYVDVVTNIDIEYNYYGKALLLFNTADYLEIALYKGNPRISGGASSLLALKMNDKITVEFS